ncbi:MAG TPA: selenium-dependent molybdenum cofactor biosynthesis protein YqeB [Anaerolineales bacterium]|nr:selenium-dependent molybdenum cofactor biosynthesis protein YqeB [Anaerolineales bacterium]
MKPIIVIRGGGDLASGIAIRLFRAGFMVLITEIQKPLSVRRTVSFSEAIYDGTTTIENVIARKVNSIDEINDCIDHEIPIIVDRDLEFIKEYSSNVAVLIDARMEKKPIREDLYKDFPFVIGIGPGFFAGNNCNVVIESNRGHSLGRIYHQGNSKDDTGIPSGDPNRVLRAPCDGIIQNFNSVGDVVYKNQVISRVGENDIKAPFSGLIRGLIHEGIEVQTGMKIGDLDHQINEDLCLHISDKALAIGGSVLEVLLSDTLLLPNNRNDPN